MKEIYVVVEPGLVSNAFEDRKDAEDCLNKITHPALATISTVTYHPRTKIYKEHPIPPNHRMSILRLMDNMDNCPDIGKRVRLCNLYLTLAEIFPKINFSKGSYVINVSNILVPTLRQEAPDDKK